MTEKKTCFKDISGSGVVSLVFLFMTMSDSVEMEGFCVFYIVILHDSSRVFCLQQKIALTLSTAGVQWWPRSQGWCF